MSQDKKSESSAGRDAAAAYHDKHKPGPDDSPVQVRPSGAEATRDDHGTDWDETDEASDESFPASDSSAKY